MTSNPQIITLPNTLATTPLDEIIQGLSRPTGQKSLPTILLYDELGLRLYDDITTKASEYYLFPAEEQILRDNGPSIIRMMHGGSPVHPGEVVLELGAGALRKTSLLLRSLANVSPKSVPSAVTYLALDLEKRELDRTLSSIASSEIGPLLVDRVRIGGLCGTYDDGIAYVRGGGLSEMHSSPLLSPSSLKSGAEIGVADNGDNSTINAQVTSSVNEKDAGHFPTLNSLEATFSGRQNSLPSPAVSDEHDIDRASSPLTFTETQSSYSTDYDETPPLHLLFLGSSIGNFTRKGAAEFLRSLPLRPWTGGGDSVSGRPLGDTLLLGLDHDNEPERIERAYNDPAGYTRKFIMNGLAGVRRAFEQAGFAKETISAFDEQNWEYQEQYNTIEKRHEGRYLSKSTRTIVLGRDQIEIQQGETIHIEHSYKYSESAAQQLFDEANLAPIHRWTSVNGLYSLWLLHRPSFRFPITPNIMKTLTTPEGKIIQALSAFPVSSSPRFPSIPTLDEWSDMWKLWDTVTLGMISPEMMMQRPIDLRHKCLFYLGHIPTFLDIHMSRLLNEPHTEPDNFKYIFERGIDPHVDDPTQCHPHSEVPENDDEWPSLDSILAFRDRVRNRLRSVYTRLESGDLEKKGVPIRKAKRVLWMTFEHEAFHVETLLYMLVQKAGEEGGTRPPPGIVPPDWESLQQKWQQRQSLESREELTVTLGPTQVEIGHNDFEADDLVELQNLNDDHEFGWDNEHPKRKVVVGKFKVERKPVSNGEYHLYWSNLKDQKGMPASWVMKDGQIMARTLFGPVPLSVARDWPLMASYDEIDGYARSKGGRIPTEAELRLFMDDQSSRGDVSVYNNAGWGYQRWWLEPPSLGNPARNEAPHNGGVWEWSSTIMDRHQGYESSVLYPGYSSDFFDGVHHVVLGGSFATIPRLAQRRSLRNFYQHNYPYAWIGARIAYDA